MLDRHALNYVNGMEQEALELLKELAQIPAPSGKEERRVVFCRDWLAAHGAEGVFIDEALNGLPGRGGGNESGGGFRGPHGRGVS